MTALKKSDIDLLKKINTTLTDKNPELSEELSDLIERMSKKPAKRAAKSVSQVVDELMTIDNEICDKQGAPHGWKREHDAQKQAYTTYMQTASEKIKAMFEKQDISKKVIDILEDENYHDIILAAKIAMGETSIESVVKQHPYV